MKKLTAALAALALAACNATQTDPAQQYRDALPQAEKIQIGTPSAQTSPGALTSSREALNQAPAYQSEYARVSYWTAVTVNVGVWWTLTMVKIITAYPPSACDDSACTWGPWPADDGLNEWKFHAEKVGDHFEYALSERPIAGAATWIDVLSGSGTPGADRDHGSGTFTIDFDAQDALPHPVDYVKEDYGVLSVTYDNRTSLAIDATLVNGRNDDPNDPHAMNATYGFVATGSGGDLQLGIVNLDTLERLSLNTRWIGTGAGRGDVHFNDGLGADYFASECWAGQALGWAMVFDDKPEPDFGSEALCAYAPAVFEPLPPLP